MILLIWHKHISPSSSRLPEVCRLGCRVEKITIFNISFHSNVHFLLSIPLGADQSLQTSTVANGRLTEYVRPIFEKKHWEILHILRPFLPLWSGYPGTKFLFMYISLQLTKFELYSRISEHVAFAIGVSDWHCSCFALDNKSLLRYSSESFFLIHLCR